MKLTLTHAADADIEGILEFGLERFGLEQALAYYDGLEQQLHAVAEDPHRYPMVAQVRPGYRRCVHGSHSVYFRINDDEVLVVRVLGRQHPAHALALVEDEP